MKQLLSLCILALGALTAWAAPAPDFTITTSDGQQRRLYADYVNQKKLVVIEAFFTTCPPCNTHAPHWQALYNEMLAAHPGKVEFLMLSTQNFDKNTNVATYKTNKGLTMPAAGQDGGSITALTPYINGQFGNFLGTPTFIVIAPSPGEVLFDVRGTSAQNTMALLTSKINELLVERCDIKDFFGNAIPQVTLSVDGPVFDTTLIVDSPYTLSGISKLSNAKYKIIPSSTDNPLNGLTTLDLALITKHILGIEPFRCPWQLLAADVNCSGTITTFDVVTARKVILGIDDNLPCGSWRFTAPKDSAANGGCVTFQGAKIGNVNAGPNCPNIAPEGNEDRGEVQPLPYPIWLEDRPLRRGETYNLPVYALSDMSLQALQWEWALQPGLIQVERISSDALPDFSQEQYHAQTTKATVAWYRAAPITVSKGDVLFWVRIQTLADCSLREALQGDAKRIPAVVYDAGGLGRPVKWVWDVYTLQKS